MAGLNAALEIGKNALLNAQVQIQTTSHNVANAENPNYSRQKAPTVTQGAILGRAGWIGAGARLDRIVQQRDTFLEGRSLDASSQSAYYGTLERILTAAETSLSDDGDTGLYAALNDFWTAWNALAQNPEGAAEKAVVVEMRPRPVYGPEPNRRPTDPTPGRHRDGAQGQRFHCE